MWITDKKEIIQLYETRIKEHGECIQTVGWRDKNQQDLRFRILSEIGGLNLKCSEILDVGCGFGDFNKYLKNHNFKVVYTGFDITPGMIQIAKSKYPNSNFEINDILIDNVNKTFEYVFASGILNKKISDNKNYMERMIKRMFDLCTIGIGINMTTSYVDYKDDNLYYYVPEEVFNYCKSLTRYVSIRHDYPLYEFTIFLYK